MGVKDPAAALEIDPAFVLDPEHRPQRKQQLQQELTGAQVPVIDLAPLLLPTPSAEAVADIVAQVGRACEEWGFFQVVNHGVSLALLQQLEASAKAFFDLPLEEKRKVRRSLENVLGFYDSELTKNRRDWKEVFDFIPSGNFHDVDTASLPQIHNQWPSTPPALREVCEKWSRAVERLAFQLLGLISQSLGLPATHFHKHWKQDMSQIRLNYYPKCPQPDVVLGVSRHKDPGALTVLVQDEVGGLEVRRKDGEWVGVKPRRDAFVINVGDIFQVWSNDKYPSCEHRVVVNENKERFSFPLFFNPSADTDVAPVAEVLGQDLPRYRPYNFGHFLAHRTTTNYKVVGGDNIQISDFAINRD